ncbi:hypothetical protein C2S51_017658 [Perilla frutescens var. frutescens]|nr:hypothetical protein C2S51_017658 [Perilla frutescens var. frutescens]
MERRPGPPPKISLSSQKLFVRLTDWVVELYDSFLFHMDDLSDHVLYRRRDRELMPLLHLLPCLLACVGFWQGRRMPPRLVFVMTLDRSIPDQCMQIDGTRCGGPPLGVSEEHVHAYRKVIEARIYSLNYSGRPTL